MTTVHTPTAGSGREPATVGELFLPPDWFPPCAVRRVVVHSTDAVEPLDDLLPCYHFIIAKSGAVARGLFSLADSAAPQRGRGYARHTLAHNIGSAGVLVLGGAPNERQWDSLVTLCRLLCSRYRLDVRDVLVHSEVEDTNDLVGWGDALRAAVANAPLPECDHEEPPSYCFVCVSGARLVAKLDGGDLWLPRGQLARLVGDFGEVPTQKHVIYGVEYICTPLRHVLARLGRHVEYDGRKGALKLIELEE
ncbi:MAG: hypothetical protein KatS3mg022_0305 [Armatimonadota bacterium]|nr:MAG: hypothetical protein KatS3mg022_0305 [Armatimonadota bacterium]